MKIAIDIGHNCNFDGGASGILNENIVVKEVGNKVIDKLRQLNHTVIYVTPSNATSTVDSLSKRVMSANQNSVELYVSIHANSGGGKGSEVFAVSSKGKEVASSILKEIIALGYVNRGIKDGSKLYVIKNTNAPACLVELFFLDCQEDCNKYNAENLANAIVKGITGQLPINRPYPGHLIQYNPSTYDAGTESIQKRLGIINDGYFGKATKEAVIRFQISNGLTADGIVGPATWNKLFN